MAGYVHRTAQERAAQRSVPTLPASLREQLIARAAEDLMAHQQRVKAGVPGCSCGQDFESYLTMASEHARHFAEVAVPGIGSAVLTAAETRMAPAPG